MTRDGIYARWYTQAGPLRVVVVGFAALPIAVDEEDIEAIRAVVVLVDEWHEGLSPGSFVVVGLSELGVDGLDVRPPA